MVRQALKELEIPGSIYDSKQSAELARIWIVDGDQVAVISPRLWNDPGAWGLMLVDLARHVAAAYARAGVPEAVALEKIKEAMRAEWSHPKLPGA